MNSATTATLATTNPSVDYDISFEVLCTLAVAANRGKDVSKLLVDVFKMNVDAVCQMKEFQVAMGVIPRPADAPRRKQPVSVPRSL